MEQSAWDISKYEPLFGDWHVEELIGRGSYGSVYKITREYFGNRQVSAVKMISIPTDEQRKDAETSMGNDEHTLSLYFEEVVQGIIKEIELLDALSDHANIIGYKDHLIRRHEDGIDWDILIRMEYSTSLTKYFKESLFTREQGIRLGIDLCSALEECKKRDIIHRDIKDDNIFISKDGVFKLGDFGIARRMSEGGGSATRGMGTPRYMAPEVYRETRYDHRADVYSLGIVLYRLFNGGCLPFIPPEKPNTAFERRMRGNPLLEARYAGQGLGKILLSACAFRPEDRYKGPEALKADLVLVLSRLTSNQRVEQLPGIGKSAAINHPEKSQGNDQALPIPTELPQNEQLNEDDEGGKTKGIFDYAPIENAPGETSPDTPVNVDEEAFDEDGSETVGADEGRPTQLQNDLFQHKYSPNVTTPIEIILDKDNKEYSFKIDWGIAWLLVVGTIFIIFGIISIGTSVYLSIILLTIGGISYMVGAGKSRESGNK